MRLLHNFTKDFYLVVIGQIISLFGNQIIRYALPLFLLNVTGSSALFGSISAMAFLPMLILYPIGGMIADRLNKRTIMVVLDFFTGILTLSFCILQGRMDIVPLMAVTMMILYGIQGAYQPAVQASVPVLVETQYMMTANSIINIISSLAGVAGPVIGGILFSMFGLRPILYVSMFCFFVSAAMELFIHIPHERKQSERGIFMTGITDLKDSFQAMFHEQPALWKMTFIFASVNLILTALVMIGIPVIVTQHLGFSVDVGNRLYGYGQGALAAGNVLGGLLAGVLAKKLKPGTIPLLIIGCALSILMGGIALQVLKTPMTVYIVFIASCSFLLMLEGVVTVQITSYIQILTPRELLGKVMACVMCVCICAGPLGQLFYGFVFEHIGGALYLPFYIAAVSMIAISVCNRRMFYGINQTVKNQADTL